ncbi:MAG: hypothetical protein GY767_07990 [Shimia sp.]|nr:hypothetical protein [Shimia sp.]
MGTGQVGFYQMTQAPTRPLADNRILRAVGGNDLAVGLGTAAGAVFQTPMMTELVSTEFARVDAGGGITIEEMDARGAMVMEVRDIAGTLNSLSGSEYDSAVSRMDALQSDLGALLDTQTRAAIDDGRIQAADDLADEYGELGLTFDRPMTAEEARILADGKRAEIIRQSLIERGPRGFIPGTVKFGAGLAAMAVDPLEVASSLIPVVGQAGRVGAIARFGRIPGRIAVGVTEGAVGNALVEPIYYGLSQAQQLDYAMNDALLNIGLGAVFGGGIGTIAGVLSRADVRGGRAALDAAPLDAAPFRAILLPEGEIPGFVGIHTKGSRATAEIAMAQFVTDAAVDVAPMMRGTFKRPVTLSEYVSSLGGIDDAAITFRGELAHAGIPRAVHKGVNNPRSTMDLDDMADLVQQAGYMAERSPDALVQALRAERFGELTFAREDLDDAATWRAWHEAKTDAEAEAARLSDVRKALDGIGVRDVTDAEVAEISRLMAVNDYDVGDAMERLAIQEDSARAEYYARQSQGDAAQDVADLRASDEATADAARADTDDAVTAVYDDIAEAEAAIGQIRDFDGLDPDDLAEIANAKALEARAETYAEIAEAAAICMGRRA